MPNEPEMDNLILFDMDGTLAAFVPQIEKDLRNLMAPNEKFHGCHWSESTPQYWTERQDLIKRQVGWWANLPVIESGFVILSLAVETGFAVGILTKGPNRTTTAWTEKFDWCKKHVAPITNFEMNIVSETKGRTYAKVLVDDYPEFVAQWLIHRKRGLGLMPDLESNRGFDHPSVVKYPADLKLSDEAECAKIRQVLVQAFLRRPNQHWKDVIAS